MTSFRNDPYCRKLIRVYRSCFQEIHNQVQAVNNQFLRGESIDVGSKHFMMGGLFSALVRAGMKVERVGDFRDDPFDDALDEGFFLVEDRFLVGTAFLQHLSRSDIRVYLYDRSWTGIHVVLVSFESDKPAWFSLDKSWPEPTFEELIHEQIKDLDEPDEYWLYMSDPEAYDRLLDLDLLENDLEGELPDHEPPSLEEGPAKDEEDKGGLPPFFDF